jgi:hypothetical protein
VPNNRQCLCPRLLSHTSNPSWGGEEEAALPPRQWGFVDRRRLAAAGEEGWGGSVLGFLSYRPWELQRKVWEEKYIRKCIVHDPKYNLGGVVRFAASNLPALCICSFWPRPMTLDLCIFFPP